MLQSFRNVLVMSTWYLFAVGSIIIMYTLLPVIYTDIWWAQLAGIAIMILTMLQVFLFGPLVAHMVDTYGARKILFAYVWFFLLGALFWYLSYGITDVVWKNIVVILMTLSFAAGFSCKFVDVYTLRTTPSSQSGIGFGILIMFAGLGRFLWTLVQPHLIQEQFQIYWPVIMIIAMFFFAVALFFMKSDLEPNPAVILHKQELHEHIQLSLLRVLSNYKTTFSSGWIFIQRCRKFPLIPLTVSFFEGIFFGSLWFIIPLYLAAHPDVVSRGLEIGIYEIVSVCFALLAGYIADKGNSITNVVIWWLGVLIGIWILYFHPSVEVLVIVWVIIGLSNNLLYATGQHILAANDVDHEHDGAYSQTRNIIANIGYMFMPVLWWLLIHLDFALILKLFSSMISSIAMLGLIVAFYLLVMREHQNN